MQLTKQAKDGAKTKLATKAKEYFFQYRKQTQRAKMNKTLLAAQTQQTHPWKPQQTA